MMLWYRTPPKFPDDVSVHQSSVENRTLSPTCSNPVSKFLFWLEYIPTRTSSNGKNRNRKTRNVNKNQPFVCVFPSKRKRVLFSFVSICNVPVNETTGLNTPPLIRPVTNFFPLRSFMRTFVKDFSNSCQKSCSISMREIGWGDVATPFTENTVMYTL